MRWSGVVSVALLAAVMEYPYAHNWITEVTFVNGLGKNAKPGKPRDSPAPNDNQADVKFVNLIDTPDLNKPACKNKHVGKQSHEGEYPAFKAAPGEWLYIKWRDNGHIVKDPFDPNLRDKKGRSNGTIYLYGRSYEKQQDDEVTLKTLRDGKWDKGALLAETPYDDGVCGEPGDTLTYVKRCEAGGGGDCKVAVRIPEKEKGEWYTIIYAWNYSLKEGTDAKLTQWYTSCVDIKLEDKPQANSATTEPPKPKAIPLPSLAEHEAHEAVVKKWLENPSQPKPWQDRLKCQGGKKVKRDLTYPMSIARSAKFRF
ncbi:hypothetical protein EX30DRAFT_364324 [Ascodesmis nigricans]|uniref:DUF7492 domain-containing protein n=1 Tax=Ascodesmis nigricans TaxID=341454 RepID=A0A4S2MVU3_9PEZI|nr:hypothetical protein EX30DRAFT_364324 [Ascodesmis nigricans]